jgi:hypothetical protein
LYSKRRHSIASLNSGVFLDGDKRISFRMALSAVNRQAVHPPNFFFSASPGFG